MADNRENGALFGSYHPGGTHFEFVDGHVGFINDTIDMETCQALSTIAGGGRSSRNLNRLLGCVIKRPLDDTALAVLRNHTLSGNNA